MGKKTEVPQGGKGETRFGSTTGRWLGREFEGAGFLRGNLFYVDFGIPRQGGIVRNPTLCPDGTPPPCEDPDPGDCTDAIINFTCFANGASACNTPPVIPPSFDIGDGNEQIFLKWSNDGTTVMTSDYELRPTQETIDAWRAGGGEWYVSDGAFTTVGTTWAIGDAGQPAGPVAPSSFANFRVDVDVPTTPGFYPFDFEIWFTDVGSGGPCRVGFIPTSLYMDVGPVSGPLGSGRANIAQYLNQRGNYSTTNDYRYVAAGYDSNGALVYLTPQFNVTREGPGNGYTGPDAGLWTTQFAAANVENIFTSHWIWLPLDANVNWLRVWRVTDGATYTQNEDVIGEVVSGLPNGWLATGLPIQQVAGVNYAKIVDSGDLNIDTGSSPPTGAGYEQVPSPPGSFPPPGPVPQVAPDPLPLILDDEPMLAATGIAYLNDEAELVFDFTYADYPNDFDDLPTCDWPRPVEISHGHTSPVTFRIVGIDGWGGINGERKTVDPDTVGTGGVALWKILYVIVENGEISASVVVGWSSWLGMKWPYNHYSTLDVDGNIVETGINDGYIRHLIINGNDINPHGTSGGTEMPVLTYPQSDDPRGIWLPSPPPDGYNRYEMIHMVDRITSLEYKRYEDLVKDGTITKYRE